ncbi:MAG: hypothetical protein HF973_19025 [Chloroflexi bacterium]|nr:hypothetical protein [Chloroflexota bacterium]
MGRKRVFLAAALLAAVAAAWPLMAQPGLLNTRGGGDSPFLLQRVQQLVTAVAQGHFPARWMPDANYGYGYPFYNFYAPLSIYVTAVFRFIGFSYVRSIQLSQLAGFLTAAVGMFYLARRWFRSDWAGLLASVAYTFAPFHMVNVYVRGDSLAEFWAMAFYPLILLAADVLIQRFREGQPHNGRYAALLALAYAALILSHNISALIFSPFLLLYLLLAWLFTNQSQTSNHRSPLTAHRLPLTLLAALLLAFALAAWFFVPALAEKSLAQLDTVTSGYFHFSNHFLGTTGQPLVQFGFLFDYDVLNRQAFRMGLVQAVTIGAGVAALLVTWRRLSTIQPYRRLFILLSLLVATFMLTPLSRLLWEYLPLLDFTQFPWRFLSVQAFVGALAVGALALLPRREIVVPVTAVLLAMAALGGLRPDYLILTDGGVTAERLAQYEWFTGNIGTTVSFEYLPPTAAPRPYTSQWLNGGERWPVKALSGQLTAAELTNQRAVRQTWQVETAVPSTLTFPTLYWPGWVGQVDGQTVEIRPSDGSGLITLDVPAGQHDVSLRLTRTPVRLAAELVSLTAVFLLLWLLKPARPKSWRPYALGLAGLILVMIGARLWPERPLPDNNLTWDFAQMGYLHHDVDGVPYDNGLILSSYAITPDNAAAGKTVELRLNWQNPVETQVTAALYSPAVNWAFLADWPAPSPLVTSTAVIQNEQTVIQLPIPVNAPAGLYVPRLQINGASPLTPSGQTRGDVFLRPIRITDSVSSDRFSVVSLDVQAVQVVQRDAETLDAQLAWFTPTPLSPNYNVGLRLTDANGQFLRLMDAQTGYGFQPSSLWPAGEWVNDWLAIELPPEEHEFPYILLAALYDARDSNTTLLLRRLGELVPGENGLVFHPTEPVFTLPEGMEPAAAVFDNIIQLEGYKLAQSGDQLDITLYWRALVDGRDDYIRFVHLVATAVGPQAVAQDDNRPRNGSYPTGQWAAGEVVVDEITLNLADLPPGEYRVGVGFYLAGDGGGPLTAVAENGAGVADGRFWLPFMLDQR